MNHNVFVIAILKYAYLIHTFKTVYLIVKVRAKIKKRPEYQTNI